MNDRRERELSEEIEFHRAMRERKYREQYGMNEKDAADRAKRDFGGFERWKEVCRDVRRWRLLDEFGRDLALALRMLRKSPLFTAVALLTLTSAIGANTAIFSLMNAVMLKDLPVPDAHRLVLLGQPQEPSGYAFHYPLFQQMAQQSESVADIFGFSRRNLQLHDKEGVSIVPAVLVTGRYFIALQVQPELGRWLGPDDDRPGAPHGAVAVVSHRFWRTRMNGDAQAPGRKLILSQQVFTVVGVMPESFRGMTPDERPDVFLPLEWEPAIDAPLNMIQAGSRAWWIQAGGRLRDGISFEQANAFLKINSPRFFEKPPEHARIMAEPGARGLSLLRLRFKKPLLVMMGLVSLVLLIACLNLATLLMARAASRGREMTTRFALGASRGRLFRQLLTESLLLAVSGSVLGFALSPLLARLLIVMLSQQHTPSPLAVDAAPDTLVFLFTAGVAILATVLTGTVPALHSTGGVLQAGLREGSPALRGAERRRLWPRLMLSLEVALALVLVTGAGLLGYSLVQLHVTPAGFDPHGLVFFSFDLAKHPINSPGMARAYQEIVEKIRRLPNVANASVLQAVPVSAGGMQDDLHVPGGELRHIWLNAVGPGYFETMGIRLLSGRELGWTDGSPNRKVLVNRSAAKLLFPEGGALGRHVVFRNNNAAEVVGVVEDSKYSNLRDAVPPTLYSAAAPQDALLGMSFTVVARTTGTPLPLIVATRRIVQRILPDIPMPAAFSMEQLIADSTSTERILATLALFFGGLALLITGIGLYGTLAYTTERRTGEIGIRLALGALPSNIMSMICAENAAIAFVGCLIGIAGSAAASKTIAGFLYGVSPKDPLVFGFAAVLLLSVAVAASLVPARKASKIDPIAAIRYE